ncbi:MAG: hypothetical protein ACK58N_16160 [Synechocystis sp.]|jgi:hypothetical protein
MINTQELDALIDSVHTYAKELQRKRQRTGIILDKLDYMCKIRALESMKHNLDTIKDLLAIEKYNLAFIGQIRIGKTNAIGQTR